MPGDMVMKLILGILNIKGYDGRSLKIVDKGEGETIPIPQQGPNWIGPAIITRPDPNMPQINPWPPQVWYKSETSTDDFIKDPSITVSVTGNTNCDITSKQLDPEAMHLTDGLINVSPSNLPLEYPVFQETPRNKDN